MILCSIRIAGVRLNLSRCCYTRSVKPQIVFASGCKLETHPRRSRLLIFPT